MISLKTRLEKAFKKLDIERKNIELFIEYIEILKEWNRHIALISKREENIVNQLIAPSLLFFKIFKDNTLKVMDLGSGAGFPALVLKIYNPSLDITMIEANSKKSSFLHYVCAKLNLNCTIINKRIEKLEKSMTCNVITVRGLKIENLLDIVQKKIKGDYLLYLTSKDNHLDLPLKKEMRLKNHSAKLYEIKGQVGSQPK